MADDSKLAGQQNGHSARVVKAFHPMNVILLNSDVYQLWAINTLFYNFLNMQWLS